MQKWPRSAEQQVDLGFLDGVVAGEQLWAEDQEAQGGSELRPSGVAGAKSKTGEGGDSVDLLAACEALAAEFTREFTGAENTNDSNAVPTVDAAIDMLREGAVGDEPHVGAEEQGGTEGTLSDVD